MMMQFLSIAEAARRKHKTKSWRVYASFQRNRKQNISAHLKGNFKNIFVPAFHNDAN